MSTLILTSVVNYTCTAVKAAAIENESTPFDWSDLDDKMTVIWELCRMITFWLYYILDI